MSAARIKLDENLGRRGAELLRRGGHDVAMVAEEELCSATDERLIEFCRRERRCLVTLDIEFGNPLRFRPADYAGIAVLRLPPRAGSGGVPHLMRALAGELSRSDVAGELWIVQAGRIRKYQPAVEDEGNEGVPP